MSYCTIEDEMFTKMTIEQLLSDLSKFTFKIADNDGRLTSDSSAALDYAQDCKEGIHREIISRLKNANRYHALKDQGRIRILGSARLGEDNQHIGLELWENYPGGQSKETRVNSEFLDIYLDACIKNKKK